MIKLINKFLNNSFRQWEYDDEQGGTIIWFALIAFVTLFVGQFIFHSVALFFSLLCLFVTFVPPIFLLIKSLVKKEKFNPLYWFLSIKGIVYGGILACIALFVIRGIMFIISIL